MQTSTNNFSHNNFQQSKKSFDLQVILRVQYISLPLITSCGQNINHLKHVLCRILLFLFLFNSSRAENAELTISTVSIWILKIQSFKPSLFFVEPENGNLTPSFLFCRTSVKAAIVLQPLLGVTNILQIAFNPYNVGNISLLSCYQI